MSEEQKKSFSFREYFSIRNHAASTLFKPENLMTVFNEAKHLMKNAIEQKSHSCCLCAIEKFKKAASLSEARLYFVKLLQQAQLPILNEQLIQRFLRDPKFFEQHADINKYYFEKYILPMAANKCNQEQQTPNISTPERN